MIQIYLVFFLPLLSQYYSDNDLPLLCLQVNCACYEILDLSAATWVPRQVSSLARLQMSYLSLNDSPNYTFDSYCCLEYSMQVLKRRGINKLLRMICNNIKLEKKPRAESNFVKQEKLEENLTHGS